jgi:hypothetical protein
LRTEIIMALLLKPDAQLERVDMPGSLIVAGRLNSANEVFVVPGIDLTSARYRTRSGTSFSTRGASRLFWPCLKRAINIMGRLQWASASAFS